MRDLIVEREVTSDEAAVILQGIRLTNHRCLICRVPIVYSEMHDTQICVACELEEERDAS